LALKEPELIVLGVDPGTAITGYGMIEKLPDGYRTISFGHISTSSKAPSQERLSIIYREVSHLIVTYRPDCLALEKLYFSGNARTAMSVGEARGVVMVAAANHQVALKEYTPLEVKMAVAGYGRATKEQIQKMVQMILHLKTVPEPDDAADALALALCHLHSCKFTELTRDRQ